ncbi:SdrD B-like domain-containing protein [Spirosoma radiotolerans]|uniref:DUF11 domain-containing protein n=1 Tax=Spirosoma radiotolerans TaxID=1379870 RepID=A0A0E3ZVB0_9BACT|nr:SdrD B-like domain-containing protein [Spirosoma radiotolerans]AKD56030.1 hypothetical protein SD10_15095 [Spirosoma radiotolerans]
MKPSLLRRLQSSLRWLLYFWVIGLGLISQTTHAYKPGNDSAPNVLGIGNLVFLDYNRNGIQDAGEPGIANVRLRLYQSGIERGQTLTDGNGQYTFATGLLPNTAYEVRIIPADFPTGLKLTGYQKGSDRELDSDAQLIGGFAVVSFTTTSTNTDDNSYDIGFVAGNPDLLVTKSTDVSQTTLGSNATFTIQVANTGSGAATNVQVRDTLDVGLAYVSSSPAATTTAYGATRILSWSVGTLTAGASASLTVTTTTRAEGVLYNTAYATTTDTENSVANNVGRSCVTVPIKLCSGEEYVASLPAQYTDVQWFRNGGTTAVGSGNSFTIVQSGSYTFTTTANASCPANGCCPIIVEDGLVPTLAITPANPIICQGQSTSLTVSGCTGGTLQWSANTASATTASILVTPTLTTVYSVTCTPTAYGTCPGVTSTTVTVNPSVTATLSSLTICNGTSSTLVATGGSTYAFSDGTTNTTGLLPVSPTVAGTFPYSVTVTSALGCSAVATATLTVNPSVTATLSSLTLCNGTSATLTATGGGTGGTYAFSGGTTNTTGQLSVSATTAGTFPYSVIVTSALGCSAVATATLTVNPSVTANITVTSTTICQGQSTTLTASGGNSYLWTTGETTAAISVTASGPYSVTVNSVAGCSGVASTTITVNPAPQLTINTLTLCAGTTATLSVSGCTGGVLTWATGDNTTSLVITPLLTTTYSATCTFPTGCSGVISTTVVVNAAPTYDVPPAVVSATCTGATANTNARIDFTTLLNTDRADISLGSSYTGPAYGAASNQTVNGGAVSFTGLPNPASPQAYTVRLYSAGGTCFTDVSVVLSPAECQCPAPKCVPVVIRKTR